MKISNLSLLLAAGLLFFACEPPAANLASKPYFDVPAYFSRQVAELHRDSLVVVKTSVVNDKTDQHQMDWTDWTKEFILFTNSDINKPSMIGKYLVDTTSTDSVKTKISYTAKDPALRTRLVEITYAKQTIVELHIVNHEASFLSTSHEELYYLPMKSYVIKSEVKNRFFGSNEFSVLGEITRKQKQYF